MSSNPSPSKRVCSGENVQPAAGSEENQEPVMSQAVAPMHPDPLTDKKPPVIPTSIRPSSSLEKTSTRPVVQSQPGQLKTVQPEPEKMAITPTADLPSSRETQLVPTGSAIQRNTEDLEDDKTPSAAGMKSRLQRLAEQRKCWDGNSKHFFMCGVRR